MCETNCGDGLLSELYEECDDNNTLSGDGCSEDCVVENGWNCSGGSLTSKSTCVSTCGDGFRVGEE